MHHDEIARGWAVYDSSNDKIGDVADVGTNYLLVQKGLIFVKDVYVPTDAIASTDATNGEVYVNVRKDAIESMGWDQPPTGTGATTGTAGSGTAGAAGYGTTDPGTGYADTGTTDQQRLALHEEQLETGTRREQAGEVQVGKRVVEDTQELEVPVTHDEVQVRRRRVDREETPADATFTQDADTIRVPVTAEQVEVSKTPKVVEEIEVSKRPVTTTQSVRETVRREEAEISKEGDVVVEDGARELAGSGVDRMERTSIDDIEHTDDVRRDTGL